MTFETRNLFMNFKQFLQSYRLQLRQIHFPLCKFTSSYFEADKRYFPLLLLSIFLSPQIPGLSLKIRLLQTIALELASCQSGKKHWAVHEVALSWRPIYP